MPITVKFFASLRESTGCEQCTLDPGQARNAAEAWQNATNGMEFPPSTLIAINMDYSNADEPLKDGDEVAFFPPVTGG